MYTENRTTNNGALSEPIRAEITAAKFFLFVVLSALFFSLIAPYYYRLDTAADNLQRIYMCAGISALNLVAWELLALGILLQSKIKILYFLLGASFKTIVILLLVHQLKAGQQGFLKLQLVSLVVILILSTLSAAIFRRWLFENIESQEQS